MIMKIKDMFIREPVDGLTEYERINQNIGTFFMIKHGISNFYFGGKQLGKGEGEGGTESNENNNDTSNNSYSRRHQPIETMEATELLSIFDFNKLISIQPLKGYRRVYDIEFNNNFKWDMTRFNNYEYFKMKYKRMSVDDKHRLNELFGKIAAIINGNCGKWYDGGVIIWLSMIAYRYIKYGVIDVSEPAVEEMDNIEAQFYMFMTLQCFSSKEHKCKLLLNGKKICDIYRYSHIRNRMSNKGYRSKGQLPEIQKYHITNFNETI